MPASRDSLDHIRRAKQRIEKEPRMPKPRPKSYGKSTVMPTRKWLAATVVGAGTIGVDWAQAGHWSTALTVAAIGFGVQRAVAYLIPNKES